MLLFAMPDLLNHQTWINLFNTGRFDGLYPSYMPVWMLVHALVAVVILLVARVAVGILARVIARTLAVTKARSGDGERRLSTVQGVITSTLSYIVYFIALIMVLFSFGVTWKVLAPLLGLASILGLAIGFGAQRLVRDIITGLFILGENQFDVGDLITTGGVTGRVEDMGLRVTRIRDDSGKMFVIANGDITQIFNASRGPVKLPIEVAVARTAPLDTVIETMRLVADEVIKDCKVKEANKKTPTVYVTGMEAAKITLKVTLWVPASETGAIENAFRTRLLGAFEQKEITLA
ncbi:MAG: mechanosensitive ion channel family protein [Armatimonadota bacterium]